MKTKITEMLHIDYPIIQGGMQHIAYPVLAAAVSNAGGGIVDGRGIIAALALGAEAVVMGTRFLASTEAPISRNHKEWITRSTGTSTILIQKSIRNMMRAADNAAARTCLDMEQRGASLQELMTVISGARGKEAYQTGRLEDGIFPMGMGCCLIREIKSVDEIMSELVEEMKETLRFVGERMRGVWGR